MRIGYGRVSTRDQNADGQRDALAPAGCRPTLVDTASGKLASRPKLDEALAMAESGDQLVVTKLDRLGRSLEHLIALSRELQARGVDLVVLDQGIDTSTDVGRMFFQILIHRHQGDVLKAMPERHPPAGGLGCLSGILDTHLGWAFNARTLAKPRPAPTTTARSPVAGARLDLDQAAPPDMPGSRPGRRPAGGE